MSLTMGQRRPRVSRVLPSGLDTDPLPGPVAES